MDLASRGKKQNQAKRARWQTRAAAVATQDSAVSTRRWGAARTTRENGAHWAYVNSEGINAALLNRLDTLRARCAYEVANNGIIEGMIRRYCADVSGPDGPTLQVKSSNKAYNDKLETLWYKWSQKMDLRGRLQLPDMIQSWTRSMFLNGEFFALKVNSDRDDLPGLPKLRIQCIDPRRVGRGMGSAGPNRFMGIEVDHYNRPVRYFVESYTEALLRTPKQEDYPASSMFHHFEEQEPEQLRGVPWLAPVLQDIADIRDYDQAVLDAAQGMADHAICMQQTDEAYKAADMPFEDYGETVVEIPRKSVFYAPAGYTAQSLQGTQPTTNYVEHRRERLQDVGACRQIPMLKLLGNASDHNYSSARLDSQDYWNGIQQHRGSLVRAVLDDLVHEVAREGGLMLGLPPMPEDAEFVWTWAAAPHVDPTKEADAQETLMGLALQTFAQGCIALGRDPEQQMAALVGEVEEWRKAGLQHPVERVKTQQDGPGRPPKDKAGDGGGKNV